MKYVNLHGFGNWNPPGEGAPNAQTRDQPGETGVEGEGGQKEAAPNHGKQACSDGQDQQVLCLELHLVAPMPKVRHPCLNNKGDPCQI